MQDDFTEWPESGGEPGRAPARADRSSAAIGPYVLLEKIGEGGFGEVWAAEQTQPVRRRVALKVLKAGMDTRSVLARFEAERQALALMDHPGIAKVLDAGETDRGRPYFVMELVKGEPINAHCDRHTLSIRQRLEIFIDVCLAVQHAHQKGIIHRDLKPSNILVTLSDDRPLPKVIDFGIAKATNLGLTERTLYTEQGMLIGTPEYMSPEQADMSGLDVDTRTDVYSLGVVLYELLTGTVPFDSQTLRRSGFAHIRDIIRGEEPPKPSTKVGTRGKDSAIVARRRRTDTQRLSRDLRGELDWIVLKALEKDRTRRYESASAFAADVRRYMSDQPVAAGPPSTVYRMRKFAKRHRRGLVIGSLVLACFLWEAYKMNRQRIAEARARGEAEAVTDFLEGTLAAARPVARGRDVTLGSVMDEAAGRIAHEFDQAPLVRARLMATIGGVYTELGRFDAARPLLDESLALRERELGAGDPLVAESAALVARLDLETAAYEKAKLGYERALAIQEAALGGEHAEVGATLNDLGVVQREMGDLSAARASLERALAIRERALGGDDPKVAETLNNLGIVFWSMREFETARPLLERSIAIEEKALGPDDLRVAGSLVNFATFLRDVADTAAARESYERSLAIQEKVLGHDHPDVALSLTGMANLRAGSGDLEGARALYEEALAIQEKAFGPDHPDVSMSLNNLAVCLMDLEEYEAARPLLERALAIREKVYGREHFAVAQGLNNLAYLFAVTGDYAAARPLLERAMAIEEKVLGPDDIHVADTAERLAEVLRLSGNTAAAEEQEARARAIKAKVDRTG